MQLKNNLYQIIRQDADCETATSFELHLNPECFIYKAHFPGQPITPGVCIVQMGKELLEEMTGKALDIVFVKNVKFLSVLAPQEADGLQLTISKVAWSDNGQEIKAQITVTTATETKAKISLVCRINDRAY
jgi:3-hydroxyacyl-[acyl-carrier-protein] dehydratase